MVNSSSDSVTLGFYPVKKTRFSEKLSGNQAEANECIRWSPRPAKIFDVVLGVILGKLFGKAFGKEELFGTVGSEDHADFLFQSQAQRKNRKISSKISWKNPRKS